MLHNWNNVRGWKRNAFSKQRLHMMCYSTSVALESVLSVIVLRNIWKVSSFFFFKPVSCRSMYQATFCTSHGCKYTCDQPVIYHFTYSQFESSYSGSDTGEETRNLIKDKRNAEALGDENLPCVSDKHTFLSQNSKAETGSKEEQRETLTAGHQDRHSGLKCGLLWCGVSYLINPLRNRQGNYDAEKHRVMYVPWWSGWADCYTSKKMFRFCPHKKKRRKKICPL